MLVISAYSIHPQNIVSKVLSHKVFIFLGLISYSIYLWHWPLIAFFKTVYNKTELHRDVVIVIGLASILLGYLFYKFIETPFRRKDFILYKSISKLLWKPKILGLLLVIFILLGGFYLFGYLSKKPVPDQVNTRGIYGTLEPICMFGNLKQEKAKCTFPNTKGEVTVVAFGDSLSWNNIVLIDRWAKKYDIGYIIFSQPFGGKNESRYKVLEAVDFISKMSNIKMLIISYHPIRYNGNNLEEIIKKIAGIGHKTIYINNIFNLQSDPRTCRAYNKKCALINNNAQELHEIEQKEIVKYNFFSVDLYHALDPYIQNGYITDKSIFIDTHHITLKGLNIVADYGEQYFDQMYEFYTQ